MCCKRRARSLEERLESLGRDCRMHVVGCHCSSYLLIHESVQEYRQNTLTKSSNGPVAEVGGCEKFDSGNSARPVADRSVEVILEQEYEGKLSSALQRAGQAVLTLRDIGSLHRASSIHCHSSVSGLKLRCCSLQRCLMSIAVRNRTQPSLHGE